MQAFDVDGVQVVSDLEEIRWDRHKGGGLVQQHLGHEVVWMASRRSWAVVLICVRDWKKGGWQEPRYVVSRWRRERGAWRLFAHFRLPTEALVGLCLHFPLLRVTGEAKARAQGADDGEDQAVEEGAAHERRDQGAGQAAQAPPGGDDGPHQA